MAPEQALGLVRQSRCANRPVCARGHHVRHADRAPALRRRHAPRRCCTRWLTSPIHRCRSSFPGTPRTSSRFWTEPSRKRQQDRFEGVVEFAQALSAAAGIRPRREPTAVESAPRVRAPFVPCSTARSDLPRPSATRTCPAASIVSRAVHSGPSRWDSPFSGWPPSSGTRVGTTGSVDASARRSHHLSSLAAETWRAFKNHGSVPAPEATALPIASREIEPAVKERRPGRSVGRSASSVAARQVSARHIRPRRSAVSRSGWQTIQLVSLPPLPPSEDVAAAPRPEVPAPSPTEAPDDLPIPEPAPSPPDVTAAR